MAPCAVISLPLLLLLIPCAMLPPPAAASRSDLLMLDRFHRWMGAHGRSYRSAEEKLRRLEAYRRNVELIEATNKESWRLGYELGENDFTDLTNEEFTARYTGGTLVPKDQDADDAIGDDGIITTLAGDVNDGGATSAAYLNLSSWPPRPSDSFDWRTLGAVTPAKNQGSCDSCWAFAAVATVESLNKIKGGKLLDLSEQELIDCDVEYSLGCSGGWPKEALRWIQARGGLMTEADYSYQARQGQCMATDSATRVGKITGVRTVRGEPQMKVVVFHWPMTVSIDAHGPILQNYKTGIYKGPCTTLRNHAVVLVGYGITRTGEEYWIVKNSWGDGWGQKGFFYMRRGADGEEGLCGVAKGGTYATM